MFKRRVAWCMAFTLLASCVALSQEKPTYAERLGYPKGARVVMFHCDDAGMCHEQNKGAIKALEYGILTSVSTMMPCPWLP